MWAGFLCPSCGCLQAIRIASGTWNPIRTHVDFMTKLGLLVNFMLEHYFLWLWHQDTCQEFIFKVHSALDRFSSRQRRSVLLGRKRSRVYPQTGFTADTHVDPSPLCNICFSDRTTDVQLLPCSCLPRTNNLRAPGFQRHWGQETILTGMAVEKGVMNFPTFLM